MNRAGLALAWSLSALVLVLEPLTPGILALDGVSRFGLALLPWVALAGLPGTDGRVGEASGGEASGGEASGGGAGEASGILRRVGWTLGLAAPPLGLAIGLDHAGGSLGVGPREGSATALLGLLLVALIAAAAAAPAGVTRARRLHAVGWFLWIPGIAALHAAIVWAPRGGSTSPAGDTIPAVFFGIDPLLWIGSWAGAGDGPGPGPAWRSGLAVVAAGVLLLAVTAALARRARGDEVSR